MMSCGVQKATRHADPRRAGPSSVLCGCGTRFSTRPGLQAAYRAEAGVGNVAPAAVQATGPEGVGTSPATRTRQPADDAPSAPVMAAWPEPGPGAISSISPEPRSLHESAGLEAALEQAPEEDQDPTPPEPRSWQIHPPDHQASAPEEPDEHPEADEDWDISDWLGAP